MEKFYSVVSTVITYLDVHQGLLTLILTIIGWFVLLWLGLYHSKASLKNEAKLKVYEDLLDVKNDFDKSFSIDLALKISSFELESVIKDMEHFDEGKKYLITTGVLDNSYMYWNRYFRELVDMVTKSHEDLLRYYNRLERWLGVIPNLKSVRDLWFKTSNDLYRKLWEYNSKYIAAPVTKNDPNWKEGALIEAEKIRAEVDKMTGYTEDLNILIHDHLLSPIFKYKKKERDLSFMDKDVEYTALTKNGFIQRRHKIKPRSTAFRRLKEALTLLRKG